MFAAFSADRAACLDELYNSSEPPSAKAYAHDIFSVLDRGARFVDANVEVVPLEDDLDCDLRLLDEVKEGIVAKLRDAHVQLQHTHKLLEAQEQIQEKAREFFKLAHDDTDKLFANLMDNARIYNASVVQKHQELRAEYGRQCARAHVLLDRLNLTRFNDDFTCCICMENPVDLSIVPCGHTLCSMCMARTSLGLRACHKCKAPVENTMRLFF
jgi:Zinc finger, C3HC4 type (RING finger)